MERFRYNDVSFKKPARFNYNLLTEAEFGRVCSSLDGDRLITYMLELSEANRRNPSNAAIVRLDHIGEMKMRYGIPQIDGPPKTDPFQCSWASMPAVHEIIAPTNVQIWSFRTENEKNTISHMDYDDYVLAGGSVVLAARGYSFKDLEVKFFCDYDFYPVYDRRNSEMTPLEQVQQGYDNFGVDVDSGQVDVVIRGRDCTTIRSDGTSLQIVHRGHPSPVSVVAGFDQMCCRAFFDGEAIYLTVECALCIIHGINPIDWRRESPTHLLRGLKYYQRGFSMIFPGLPKTVTEVQLPGYQLKYTTLASVHVPEITGAYSLQRTRLNEDGEQEISDYATEIDAPHRVGANYGGLLKAIKTGQPISYLATDQFGDKAKVIDIRATLVKLHDHSDREIIYKPDGGQFVAMLDEISRFVVRFNDRARAKVIPLSPAQLARFVECQHRINEIIDAAVVKYDYLLNTQRELFKGVRFEMDNPGKQFTGSFQPIIRRCPADYWSDQYVDFEHHLLYKVKLTLLCIRKFDQQSALRLLDLNIMKLVFDNLDYYYFRLAVAN